MVRASIRTIDNLLMFLVSIVFSLLLAWCNLAQGDDPAPALHPESGRVQLRDCAVGADHGNASFPEHDSSAGSFRSGEQEHPPDHPQ